MKNGYHGFTAQQREKNLRALNKLKAEGRDPTPEGPCMLCLDPEAHVELHSEDYSEPFQWEPPACYGVCSACHWWIHQRFHRPELWEEFKHHVARGGYAREYRRRKTLTIPAGRPEHSADEWWLKLSTKCN